MNYTIARIDSTDKLSYYLFNGHGDVVLTVKEDGTSLNQYDYDIFGNPTLTVESYSDAIRYAGEFYDESTELYYLRARYYAPYVGRFISEDSFAGYSDTLLSLNLYTYCHNDPIQNVAPSGHATAWDKANLSSKQVAAINKAHASAEAIRNTARSSNEVGSSSGETKTKPSSSTGTASYTPVSVKYTETNATPNTKGNSVEGNKGTWYDGALM